jgi:hypothetical protein
MRSEPESAATEPVGVPFIPAIVSLPEITLKAVILGFVLSAVLAAANAYLVPVRKLTSRCLTV